jgi:transcriptional regulator with XRE-family HTH domain
MLPRSSEDFINSLDSLSIYPAGLSVKGQLLDYSELAFGDRLKRAREGAGITQEQLAERVGVDQVQVSKWERNDTMPRADRLAAIADGLGDVQALYWLLTGDGKPPKGVALKERERLTDPDELPSATRRKKSG